MPSLSEVKRRDVSHVALAERMIPSIIVYDLGIPST